MQSCLQLTVVFRWLVLAPHQASAQWLTEIGTKNAAFADFDPHEGQLVVLPPSHKSCPPGRNLASTGLNGPSIDNSSRMNWYVNVPSGQFSDRIPLWVEKGLVIICEP